MNAHAPYRDIANIAVIAAAEINCLPLHRGGVRPYGTVLDENVLKRRRGDRGGVEAWSLQPHGISVPAGEYNTIVTNVEVTVADDDVSAAFEINAIIVTPLATPDDSEPLQEHVAAPSIELCPVRAVSQRDARDADVVAVDEAQQLRSTLSHAAVDARPRDRKEHVSQRIKPFSPQRQRLAVDRAAVTRDCNERCVVNINKCGVPIPAVRWVVADRVRGE